jgi:hypothetical protein
MLFGKKYLIIFGLAGITICAIVGITLGVVLSRPDNFQKAFKLLDKYPLVDGYL